MILIKRNTVESAIVKELSYQKINSTTSSSILDLTKTGKNQDGQIDSTKRDEAY